MPDLNEKPEAPAKPTRFDAAYLTMLETRNADLEARVRKLELNMMDYSQATAQLHTRVETAEATVKASRQ